jgi:hypothetical protein
LVVTRYLVEPDDESAFRADAETALRVLTDRPGCTGATLGQAFDDARLWTLTTTWRQVGDYRRALSHYDVKLHAVPLMYRAVDEPSAYDEVVGWSQSAGLVSPHQVRAPDADRAGPER